MENDDSIMHDGLNLPVDEGASALPHDDSLLCAAHDPNPFPAPATVHVDQYTRHDGTIVHEHWRTAPDGDPFNNRSYHPGHMSGIVSDSEQDMSAMNVGGPTMENELPADEVPGLSDLHGDNAEGGVLFDFHGNGHPEPIPTYLGQDDMVRALDMDGDGQVDHYGVDTNGDGVLDQNMTPGEFGAYLETNAIDLTPQFTEYNDQLLQQFCQNVIDKHAVAHGLPSIPVEITRDVPNAAGDAGDPKQMGDEHIYVNPDFIRDEIAQGKIESVDQIAGIVLHEAGHAYHQHPGYSSDISANYGQELQADVYAAQSMVEMGFDPEEYAQLLEGFGGASPTHPSGMARAEVVETSISVFSVA